MYRALHDGWTLSGGRFTEVPATIPGCVHIDLLAAGLIDDPYLDDNEEHLKWIGREDWRYSMTFAWAPSAARTDLVCEGLDTVAEVRLNGVTVARTENMHRSYRFDVRELLREGENHLEVEFESPYAYAERNRAVMGDRPGPYPEPYQFIRKMACNFGWDWGPTLVTSGIWRPVGLHSWNIARLAEVRPAVSVEGTHGVVSLHVEVERASDGPLTILAEVAGESAELWLAPGVRQGHFTLRVPHAERWWPRGYGEPHLYPLTVTLAETGEVWQRNIGFRSVQLDTSPDDDGSAFTLRVNDLPVFVRGVNWIPDDCFPSRISRERLAHRFGQACDANINLLRVWGGGLYESRDFYELADERGLLVMQDFLFACAAYPEDEPLASEVRAEAREQVTRLLPHPSLVMWIGNNENFMGYADWDWPAELGDLSWGKTFYLETLPSIVSALDPHRPYWPGTPYSGDPAIHPNDQRHGTVHIWDVWNELDYSHYANWKPRFVAEFGFQGPPTFPTLAKGMHQKAHDGEGKLLRGLGTHLPQPSTDDDWHYLTQLNQARAVAFGIEHLRALAPHCMGTIVWQFNDCWPVTSWSAVDGSGRRKPLWYSLRRSYADRLLTIHNGSLALVNDNGASWQGEVSVARLTLEGEPLAKDVFEVDVAPHAVKTIELPASLKVPADPGREVIVATFGEARAVQFFAEDTAVAFPPARYDATVLETHNGYAVTVTARTLLRELALFPDRPDPEASVDDMLHTLLPGESMTVRIATAKQLDPAALTSYPVLRCLNETGTK